MAKLGLVSLHPPFARLKAENSFQEESKPPVTETPLLEAHSRDNRFISAVLYIRHYKTPSEHNNMQTNDDIQSPSA